MSRNARKLAMWGAIAALAMTALPSTVPGAETPTVERMYKTDQLMAQDAVLLAHQICLARNSADRCKYTVAGRNWFSYTADEATQAKIAEMLTRYDVPPPTLNFRVTILRADQGQRPAPDLPSGEKEALADLRNFLPYKGYQVVDAGWIRSSSEARLTLGGDSSYDVQMKFDRDEAAGSPSVVVRRFMLYEKGSMKGASEAGEKSSSRQLLSTSFSLDVGETVVVGTSRLNGDGSALIVLLTAQN